MPKIIKLPKGYLTVDKSADPNYPGFDIEYMSKTETNNVSFTRPRVLVEHDRESDDLRVLVWADPASEDYSDDILFNHNDFSGKYHDLSKENPLPIMPAKDMHINLNKGHLTAESSNDTDYPSINIEYASNNEPIRICTSPRVLIEFDKHSNQLSVFIWSDTDEKDFTDKITFQHPDFSAI